MTSRFVDESKGTLADDVVRNGSTGVEVEHVDFDDLVTHPDQVLDRCPTVTDLPDLYVVARLLAYHESSSILC